MNKRGLFLSAVAFAPIATLLAAGCSDGGSVDGGGGSPQSAGVEDASQHGGDVGGSNSVGASDAANGGDGTARVAEGGTQTVDANARETAMLDGLVTDGDGVVDTGAIGSGTGDGSAVGAIAGWTLTWSDEFNGPDGSPVDPTKWKHDVGGTGWGNNELEYYTDGTQNAVVQGGYLVITATKQGASQYHCSYGTCQYTSARLLTQGLFSQQYGRFEASVQMPTGKGLWPAVWMLGDDISTASWPACGEIDFMETIGTDISTNHGSLHMPGDNPSGTFKLPNGASFADAFHTFAIEWEPGTVRFYVDDQLYETQSRSSVPSGGTWEFEQPFFLLVNVAVGGNWPGSPDSTTTFPQTMKVDWVRVYQKDSTEP